MNKKASRQPRAFHVFSLAENKFIYTAVLKEGGSPCCLDLAFPNCVKVPDSTQKISVQEAYHSKVHNWLSRQSQEDLREIFTISDHFQVGRLMEKLKEVNDELSENMEGKNAGSLLKGVLLSSKKDAFENFKIAWTASPVFYVDPAWATKWLKAYFKTENFYFPSENACNELETEEDIESLCLPFFNFRSKVIQLSHLLTVYLRKAIARRCETAQVPSDLASIKKMKEYADKTSYLSRRSMESVFSMPVLTALNGGLEKIMRVGQDLEEKYFAHVEDEARQLMENLEKPTPVKPSKRAKRNCKKAEQARKKKQQQICTIDPPAVSINPEENQPMGSIVDSNAYKIREHQKGSITPANPEHLSKSPNPVDMFIDYFVPPTQRQQNQRKGSNSTSSENAPESEYISNAPFSQQKRKHGLNGKKRYEEKPNFSTETIGFEKETQQAASNIFRKLLENKLHSLDKENKQIWQLKNASYHRLLSYFGVRLPYFSVNIFGSLASGVSLPNSDIDLLLTPQVPVAIDEFFLSDLAHELRLFGWVTYSDAILTAKIPVIKLIVDPFVCEAHPESQFKDYSQEEQLNSPFLIKFDITLNTAGHNNTGLASSAYMQNIFNFRPRLIEAMLVVKDLLERAGLNEGYKGGVSSYNIFVMLICFAEQTQFNFGAPLADFLIKFFDFYTKEFDYQKSVLRYEPNQRCVLSFQEYCSLPNAEKLGKSGVVKMIDPINGKLVRASFSRFEEVLDLFRQLADAFKEVREKARLAAQPLMGRGNRKSWEIISTIETKTAASETAARLNGLLFN